MAAVKLRLISSPNPSTPIEHLVQSVSRYLHLSSEDQDVFTILMGAAVANMVTGEPCWLMLVGPPSCGKTEFVNSLLSLPRVFPADNPSGEQAFLSGTSAREKSKDATGGLLRQVGTHGALILNDLTSVLSKDPTTAREILSVLRECYSGKWSRPIGGDGGRNLKWYGKLAVFGGCTGEIDQFHRIVSVLGERWLYCRMGDNPSARWNKGKAALDNGTRPKWREDFHSQVAMFFDNLEMRFGEIGDRRPLTAQESMWALRLGGITSKCRSGVSRDWFSQSKEIIGVPEQENEVRITTALGQLCIGLEIIGVESMETRWRLIEKVAFDSMPLIRRLIIDIVRSKDRSEGAVMEDLVSACKGVSPGVVERAVEELEIHQCVSRIKSPEGKKVRVFLSEWLRGEWTRGWGGNSR